MTCNTHAVFLVGDDGMVYSWGSDPERSFVLGQGDIYEHKRPIPIQSLIDFRYAPLKLKLQNKVRKRWQNARLCDRPQRKPVHLGSRRVRAVGFWRGRKEDSNICEIVAEKQNRVSYGLAKCYSLSHE